MKILHEKENRLALLVRAERKRLLDNRQGKLWGHIAAQAVAGELEVKTPRRTSRPSAEDSAGRILVGGAFQGVNGSKQTNLVRLTLDGSIDTTCNLKGGPSGPVTRIVPLPNGQTLVGGLFDTISGQPYKKIARLNANGAVDATFRSSRAPNGDINELMVLNDQRVLIAGAFTKAALGIYSNDPDSKPTFSKSIFQGREPLRLNPSCLFKNNKTPDDNENNRLSPHSCCRFMGVPLRGYRTD
jgi:hypothetical protein